MKWTHICYCMRINAIILSHIGSCGILCCDDFVLLQTIFACHFFGFIRLCRRVIARMTCQKLCKENPLYFWQNDQIRSSFIHAIKLFYHHYAMRLHVYIYNIYRIFMLISMIIIMPFVMNIMNVSIRTAEKNMRKKQHRLHAA